MKVLLIEDEPVASQRLQILLKACDASIEIEQTIDTIEDAVAWLSTHPHPDVMLLDIQLSDGYSFDIFRQVSYQKPVIFTTAYPDYALDAFQYFAIDYLVKPVTFAALQSALNKLRHVLASTHVGVDAEEIKSHDVFAHESYKERFLVKVGQKFVFVKASDIDYFKTEDKLVFIVDRKGNKFLIDYTLEKLEAILDPKQFFRLNRKVIVSINSIAQVRPFSNKRLQLHLQNNFTSPELVISRERVADFRTWAEQ